MLRKIGLRRADFDKWMYPCLDLNDVIDCSVDWWIKRRYVLVIRSADVTPVLATVEGLCSSMILMETLF